MPPDRRGHVMYHVAWPLKAVAMGDLDNIDARATTSSNQLSMTDSLPNIRLSWTVPAVTIYCIASTDNSFAHDTGQKRPC